ncbi:MAG: hypothetical protein US62_C0044G0004 [Candidatus Woesebacteria bacterium GW2011_GWA1_37_8]|uniref:Small ribosomal subunit protein bS16 n=2 Tax=Candidatus Woeseibacteriota TaxID=1752722 RepID=A0A0G0NM73_9BACT|nr:MAG: hypothetical protein US39_C0016G0026 [Microgenomates group bacterium GW2011_GWC1_37_12b]KKQ43676.1 MAG: hypothetical protein US62_C0044G0004 [Candidatus Woesebacteria bacterium GW2011_GWA1_37_8]KKQ87019.1 MAG: hypothetical protein UT10_C0012G0007 [Candidatus Woesebacteria bacterium GW2011_GWB1_38_8b]
MIKIRLAKFGKRNDHFFRIVAIDEKKKVVGEPLDILGHWHPKKSVLSLDKTKLKSWIEKGAKLSPTVKKLFEKK